MRKRTLGISLSLLLLVGCSSSSKSSGTKKSPEQIKCENLLNGWCSHAIDCLISGGV